MRLYYTTSNTDDLVQTKPHLSVGGSPSVTPVARDDLSAFFDTISEYTKSEKDRKHYIALILKNELGKDAKGIKVYFDSPQTSLCQIKVAAIDLTDGKTERVQDMFTRPFYIDKFYEAEGEENAYILGDLAAGESVALWLERSLIIDKINSQELYKLSSDGYTYEAVEPETLENIELSIEWDVS